MITENMELCWSRILIMANICSYVVYCYKVVWTNQIWNDRHWLIDPGMWRTRKWLCLHKYRNKSSDICLMFIIYIDIDTIGQLWHLGLDAIVSLVIVWTHCHGGPSEAGDCSHPPPMAQREHSTLQRLLFQIHCEAGERQHSSGVLSRPGQKMK